MSATMKAPPKIRSALKHLHRIGSAALQPTKMVDPTQKRQKWAKPIVSRRIAADLRKKAIREGTFGSYDSTNGIGWDPVWDAKTITRGDDGKRIDICSNGKLPWMQIRPPKETKRVRTREARAVKIEKLLEVADDKILQHKLDLEERKPKPGIENTIKKMIEKARK